jgi:hypothetical protein
MDPVHIITLILTISIRIINTTFMVGINHITIMQMGIMTSMQSHPLGTLTQRMRKFKDFSQHHFLASHTHHHHT